MHTGGNERNVYCVVVFQRLEGSNCEGEIIQV
jgi:hypothetical protein